MTLASIIEMELEDRRQRGCPEIAGDFVDRIYPIELEIKDTADTALSASYLDIYC